MTIEQKKQHLLATLSQISDSQRRFAHVVECGRRQPALEEALKTDQFRVEGCLARLWLVPSFREGRCHFRTDSDSAIMKGVAGLLCEFYSGQTPEEVVTTTPYFLADVGITQHLSPNRRNGLGRIWERMRDFAAAQRT